MFRQILQVKYHLPLIYQSFVKILKPPHQIHQTIRTSIYITVDKELVETSSKRQNTLSSFTWQTRNINTVIRGHDASCSYILIPNNMVLNLKEYAHPNWDSDIPCTMPTEKILGPNKQNMQNMFKFTKNNLEDMLF